MIRTGDKVKILNENAEGTVKKIISEKFVLVQIGDFDYQYSVAHLIKVEDHITESALVLKLPDIENVISGKEEISSRKIKFKKGKKSAFVTEVDLHSSEIISDTSGMAPTQILNFQIKYFINALEKAIAKKEKQIIFIHGKGEGILKAEICRILKSYNLNFYDAPLNRYGGGATSVELMR